MKKQPIRTILVDDEEPAAHYAGISFRPLRISKLSPNAKMVSTR